MTEIVTPAFLSEAQLIVKRSRFIAAVSPCADEREALLWIESMKKKYHDATHNVWAYSFHCGEIRRCSDDGEPQGTAGMPVLNALLHSGLTNCAVVVTRYFGGVLLGAGGLVHAYSDAAKAALDGVERVVSVPWCRVEVQTDYANGAHIQRMAADYGGKTENAVFAAEVQLTLRIPPLRTAEFLQKLTDLTGGKAAFHELGTVLAAKENENS